MAGSDEDLLLRLSAQIADGERIDWAAAADLPAELREQVRRIELLAGGFHGEITESPPSAVPPALAEGDHFGSLQIRGLLGSGGYGHVHRAYDPELDRDVALKLVGTQRRSRADILREARLMARIDHPNVLKVYGALEDHERIGFVFELIEGETLEHWLGGQAALGSHALIAIGLELCAALCALHQGQVLHGDLKPSNILRHASGRWIVADFGSGQHALDTSVSSGTPLYMAPELFADGQPSAASDQYALAAVLFRLATRRHPCEGDSVAAIAAQHARADRLRLIDLRPDLPLPLIEAIERGLASDPRQRFASVGLFAAALSTGMFPASRPTYWRRGLPWLAAAALLTVALLWLQRPTVLAEDTELTWWSSRNGMERILRQGEIIGADDGLALGLRLDRPRHVYVVNQDQAGARFQLFPLQGSELSNPLPAGTHVLPGKMGGEAIDWRVTSRGGREYFLVVVADDAIVELNELGLAEASALQPDAVAQQDTVRGIGGLGSRVVDASPDWSWIERLKRRYPTARFETFELTNP